MAIIDRVKYDGPGDVLVWRHPPDDLSWGTQVIVNQTQEALFFKGGQILDILPAGTHTLRTANIPILRRLVNIPFGDETPFAAEIYFVNKAVNLDVKWGTQQPIPVLDPRYQVYLPVRAFGQFGVRVADSRKFVVNLAGTMPEYTAEALQNYFRGIILTKAKDYIAETIVQRKINLLEISAYLEDLSTEIHGKLAEDFANFGIELVNFMLQSINVSEEDPSVQKLKKALADKAEIDILGGANYQMKRTFDTMETAAGNEGGGGAGAGLGLGMGLGAGAGMGGIMGQMMGGMMQMQPQAPTQNTMAAQSGARPNPPGYQTPVVVEAIGFEASLSSGKVSTKWKRYKRPDFKAYCVVKSSVQNDPRYPDDGGVFYTAKSEETSFEDPNPIPGTWHYRVVVVTQKGERWVSPVVTLDIGQGASHAPSNDDFG